MLVQCSKIEGTSWRCIFRVLLGIAKMGVNTKGVSTKEHQGLFPDVLGRIVYILIVGIKERALD